jgi:hypothetical protein
MSHGELKQQVIETSLRLIDESEHGEVSGEDVAHELGMDPKTPELYDAFRVANDQGSLSCEFPGRDAVALLRPASVVHERLDP